MKVLVLGKENVSRKVLDTLVNEMETLIDRYNLKVRNGEGTPLLELSKRMKSVYGRFVYNVNVRTYMVNSVKIQINLKALDKFGLDNVVRTLRHEMAHWIQYQEYGYSNHNDCFKRICNEVGGALNTQQAGEKYAHLADGTSLTTFRWQYTCPTCGASFKAAARRKRENRQCRTCKTAFIHFREERIG